MSRWNPKPAHERVLDRVLVADCWLFQGSLDTSGYGIVKHEGKSKSAHRVVYEALVGPVPEGLQLDHLCRVRHCCNPDHLEPVTAAENQRRGEQGQRTHCKNGHPLDRVVGGKKPQRVCSICRRESWRQWKARQT